MATINKNILYWILFAVFSLFLIYASTGEKDSQMREVVIAGQTLRAELALTPESQAQGLSDRNSLAEDAGMLFVFDRPGKYPFWMKDMNFAIDIIWIGEDLRIVYIKKDARPESYPEAFGPGKDAKYVLEVVSGFSEKNNLKEGDKVEFL